MSAMNANRFDHRYMQSAYVRGLRTGSWHRLSLDEKGLFRCALWVAKVRGRLSNMRLMVRVAGILVKLLTAFKAQLLRVGRVRAERLGTCLREAGAEKWASEVLQWLTDRSFITYLGVLATNEM